MVEDRNYLKENPYVNYRRIGANIAYFSPDGHEVSVIRGSNNAPNLRFAFDVRALPVDVSGEPVDLIYRLHAKVILNELCAPKSAYGYNASFLLGTYNEGGTGVRGKFTVNLDGRIPQAIFLASGQFHKADTELLQFYVGLKTKYQSLADWHSVTYHGLRMQYFYVLRWRDLIGEAMRSPILSAYVDVIEEACKGYYTIEQLKRLTDVSDLNDIAETSKVTPNIEVTQRLERMDYIQRYELFRDEIVAMGGTFEPLTMIGVKVFLPTFEEEQTFKMNEIAFSQFIDEFEKCRKTYQRVKQQNQEYLLRMVLQNEVKLPEKKE